MPKNEDNHTIENKTKKNKRNNYNHGRKRSQKKNDKSAVGEKVESISRDNEKKTTLRASANEYTPSTTVLDTELLHSAENSLHEEEKEDDSEMEREKYQESYERASADLEILTAAYPEEINIVDNDEHVSDTDAIIPSWFPLVFTLSFSMDPSSNDFSSQFGANITIEFPKGYPAKALSVVSYRSSHIVPKEVIEKIVSCVKNTASEAVEVYGGEECGLQCCAAALDCWNEWIEESRISESQTKDLVSQIQQDIQNDDDINWISSENLLVDRKSTFQAHICVVDSDDMVRKAVNKLIDGSSKIQRATHNMFAYRFIENIDEDR
ncbi:hypothetical protein CTEN210_10976 [Chaetoceros tenuissimus]|uniref:RWD domain-containing protein n=1 Tax=Chaetoceros tenuissimus TaxID=426638 RepID=A0AAD3H8P0_9STRA|nr:hypothetical protein CTEN210_10976 [Chaetoceros tenuissimus]